LIQIKPIQKKLFGELRHAFGVAVKNLRALETMELKMDALFEQVMIDLISNRLNLETRKAYEIQLKPMFYQNGVKYYSFFNKDPIRSNQEKGGIPALH
jgi:hypothetical protein